MSELVEVIEYKGPHKIRDSIRKRPGMYVPGTDFWGLINYLVAPFSLSLNHGASSSALTAGDDDYFLESDARLQIEELDDESIMPFEGIVKTSWGHGLDAAILNALSATLEVDAIASDRHWQLSFEEGECASRSVRPSTETPNLRLRFRPDPSIFTVTEVSPVNINSYLSRICHLNPGVDFTSTIAGRTSHYHSRGMIDLFESVSQPYQYLHKPIEIRGQDGDLEIELVCAFHSWHVNHIWTFINKGRAAEGGTHEEGLEEAIQELPGLFGMQRETGVIAVMAVRYPDAVFEGCIKARVGSPELKPRVKALVIDGARQWAADNPAEIQHLSGVEVFQFADIW